MKNKTLKIVLVLIGLASLSLIQSEICASTFFRIPDTRWKWLRHRLIEAPPETIDYAIVGTSKIWCAIRSRVVSREIPGITIWNLGRSYYGKDADFFIVEQLLERHHVRNLLYEFDNDLNGEPHPYTQHIIRPHNEWESLVNDMRELGSLKNGSLFRRGKTLLAMHALRLCNLSVRPYVQLLTAQRKIDHALVSAFESADGFFNGNDLIKPDPSFLENNTDAPLHQPKISASTESYRDQFSLRYLRQLKEACDRHRVRLFFAYVPSFRSDLPDKRTVRFLSESGDVLLPDIGSLYRLSNWRNQWHLYLQGTEIYTRNLVELLKNGKEASPYYSFYTTNEEPGPTVTPPL